MTVGQQAGKFAGRQSRQLYYMTDYSSDSAQVFIVAI